jgi:serine/threonine-protein phosphatase 2A regulatory subunit A
MIDNKTNPVQADPSRANAQLYPIAVLIDELKNEEQKKRINAVKNLNTISVALGPERTRTELLPYILELLDDDEEVLLELADSIGSLLTCCGGPAHAEHLLRVLEKLCGIEESSVREKVSSALNLICSLGY